MPQKESLLLKSIGISLFKTNHVPKWQGVLITICSLMLANPEIKVINFFASFFLATGLIPYSIKLLKQISISDKLRRN